jgi:hypothetical protein
MTMHRKVVPLPGKGNPMTPHRKHRVLTLVILAGCAAGLLLSASFGAPGARAQNAPAPLGHRQPRTGDVPSDSSRQSPTRSPEDIVLERALNNICRGCSPIIPVRAVPRYDIARTCPAGQGNDTCRNDEERARQTLNDQWATFTEKARSDCVQTNEIGGRPSYVQLGICLKTAQIAPTLPEGR